MAYYGDAFDRAKALLAAGPLAGERVPGPPSAPLLVSGAELPPEVAQRLFPQGRTILAVTDAPSSGVAEVRHVPLGHGGLPSEVALAVDAGARSIILVGGTSAWSVLLLWHLWRRGVRTAIVARPNGWETRHVESALASALLCKLGLLPLRVTARLRAGARAFTARSFMASPRLAQVVRRSRRVAGRVSPGRVDPQPWKAYADTVSRDRSVEPAPPFRVALYLGTMNAGGAERQHGNLAVGLRERGHDARLWTTLPLQGSDAHYGDLFLDRGVPVAQAGGSGSPEARWHLATTVDPRLVRSLPSALQTAVLDLAGELLRDPPHILHCTLDHTNVVGLAAGLLAGVPRIVLSTRNINPSNFVFFQPWMNPWYRFAATLPQVRFIANSRHGAQDYAEWMGVDPSRFAVILNGVDLAGLPRPEPSQVEAVRHELEANPQDPVLAGVFRLSEEKRPFLFLDVVTRLVRAIPNLRVALVGIGTMAGAIEGVVAQRGLQRNVFLLGRRQDVGTVLSAADGLLLTSTIEGTPNVVLEAQWFRAPPIATAVGGTPDVVVDGVTGILCGRDDADALVHGALRVLQDRELRNGMGEAGHRHIRDNFSMDRMVERTLAVYEDDSGVPTEPAWAAARI